MKKRIYKRLSMIILATSSACAAVSNVYAANYNNPTITQISPVFKSTKMVPPNIFLVLDDSGSMALRRKINYNSAYAYQIPPDPKKYDPATGKFGSFDMPSGYGNGFQENGYNFTNGNSGFPGIVQYDPSRCGNRYFISDNCKIFRAFYSTRLLALKSSLAIALTSQQGDYDLDFDFINNALTDGIDLKSMSREIDARLTVSPYQRNMAAFLEQLYSEDADGGTPTRMAVYNLYKGIEDNAGAVFSDNDGSGSLSCKQNHSIILSDGQYNGELSQSFNNTLDYDGGDYSWILKTSNTATDNPNDTVDVAVDFKGDGSVKEQRIFAGGRNSYYIDYRRVCNGFTCWAEPYKSTPTLTDIVLKGWADDLSTLPNNVKPYIGEPGEKILATTTTGTPITLPEIWNPKNDPANWQHIVTYTMGLGIGSQWENIDMARIIFGVSPFTVADGVGKRRWPDLNGIDNFPNSMTNRTHDFERSGYVGRGGFSRVDNPEQIIETFSDIFDGVIHKSGAQSASGTATTASQITTQSRGILFSTELDVDSRSGNLKGTWMYNGVIKDDVTTVDINEKTSNGGVQFCYGEDTPPTGAFVGQLCTKSTAAWSAIEQMPTWNQRNIFSYNPGTKLGIAFDYGEMHSSQKKHFDDLFTSISSVTGNDSTKLVDFIKGDNQLATGDHTDIRQRSDGEGANKTPLGDFARGGPAFLGAPNKAIWDRDLTASEIARAVAFAGANDGMLHAFDGVTGRELFAYIPNAVYKNLKNLILPKKEHTAFVDGKIVMKDIDNNKTILVSGMGAGAKGLFALDVTNPNAFDHSKVLWEIDESTDPRLGHIFGKPSIIRVEGTYKGQDDRWVVVVGTGYGNNNKFTAEDGTQKTNRKNGILVLDALTGEVLQFLKLPQSKGVGEITWIDHQKQANPSTFKPYYDSESYWGEMDRGYVGDLKGNVWVLDFAYDKSATATTLKSAITAGGDNTLDHLSSEVKNPDPKMIQDNKPAPLFIATDSNGSRQPITTTMMLLQHPSNRGYMVYFGTGELFDINPFKPNTPNSMYGIWDDIGDNYGDIKTADLVDNNKTRSRFFLTYYPWESITTTFSDGRSAFARVPSSGRTSMVWANFQGNTDSSSQDAVTPDSRTEPSSGWVVDTGRSTAGQYERVFQPPYSVINEYKEAGVTFSMSTLTGSSDPCISQSGGYTWNMTFRTDVIDGPFAAFTTAQTDSNRDGQITEDDNISVTGSGGDVQTGVALGAILSDNITLDGVPNLVHNPTIVQSPRGGIASPEGAGDFCPSGTARSYKKALSAENEGSLVEEVNICIPSTMSSWSEIE